MTHHSSTPQKFLLCLTILGLVGYAFFNSRFMLQGPDIVLAGVNPDTNIIHTNTRDFSLQGTVKHSSYITLNNRPILVDEHGNFKEKLLLSDGVSIIDLYARDKFGKETREKIDVVYAGESDTQDIAYDELALRAKEHSTSTSSSTPDTEEPEETPDESPLAKTAIAVTASSSIMTIAPSSGL